ncbi:hypothetical protein DL768_004726 [Monosporascus sp. mg162]|nr:hypothetical protein DL768_004726 [Monosporascus sp. mg162]
MRARCRRSFSSSTAFHSGHNRWSKIRHEKGAADQKKTLQRNTFAKHLTLYSRLYGPDPNMNPQLASVIATAKKAGMPKANIDVAIARGQGKSSTGEGLETATLEVMMPSSSAAMVIDIESDNRQRSLKDLRVIVKKYSGNVTPTAFLFTRLGRTVLRSKGEGASAGDFDDIFMQAVDAGAEDVEQDDDGSVVLWTQPNVTHQVAHMLAAALGMEIHSSDIVYSPTSDKVKLDEAEAASSLSALLAAVREYPDVQAVYANVEKGDVSEEVWKTVEEHLDS